MIMRKNILGRTGIEVTELCFGALPMGPLQRNLTVEESAAIIEQALHMGVNFIDTAQMYKTYEPIALAIKNSGIRPILASKSNMKSYQDMEAAVNEALQSLGVDYIDIFHLHAAREGADAFEVYADALRCLVDLKKIGKIKAIGISTHSVSVANLAADHELIDVVFPIINMTGMGLLEGTKEEMIQAIKKLHKNNKGVYLMKVLAGGSLINCYHDAMKFARDIESYHSIALGMTSFAEVEFNINYFEGKETGKLPHQTSKDKKALVSRGLCKSCGKCIEACPNNCISFDEDGKASIDKAICLTCGYCTPVCPEFAIRIV
ncbi:MAG: aldo/keto reductase [Clostridia bacterium]|jgi:aryl-alcohol dehydrogenase-like predicted oxidoreductase/Pyruvate/2-oxoacid:ferredoxin oxidoreductase delta subunit|nr:aldo/keto reductase [Clostridia bacterium]